MIIMKIFLIILTIIQNNYLYQKTIKEIIIKLNFNELVFNECFEWINYYFDNNIYYKLIKYSKKNFHIYY